MPFPTTFHHHFQHPSVPPNAGRVGSGVPALTMEQIEELFPDWQLQFQQHAEDAGYPSTHWPEKSLWSPLVPQYVAGTDLMWIQTTLPFNLHPDVDITLLAKALPVVQRMYEAQLTVFTTTRTAAFLPMQGPRVEGWWEHGSILIQDPASLFVACVAYDCLGRPAGDMRLQSLRSLSHAKRGRPAGVRKVEEPTKDAKREEAERVRVEQEVAKAEFRLRYDAWLEECRRVRERKARLKAEIEQARQQIKDHLREIDDCVAPECPKREG